VQGQYDSNYRRFGERYAQGDQIARKQLKDIIVTLQSGLLTNLRLACEHDDVEPDYAALQTAADNSRVDAVVALCRLYQRLAAAAPLQAGPKSFSTMTAPGTGASVSQHTQQWSVHLASDRKASHASTVSSSTTNMSSDGYTSSVLSSLNDSISHHSGVEQLSPLIRERRASSIRSTFSSGRRALTNSLPNNSGSQSPSNSNHGNSPGFSSKQFPITPVSKSGAEGDYMTMYDGAGLEVITSMQSPNLQHEQRPLRREKYLPEEPAQSLTPFSPAEIWNSWTRPDLDEETELAVAFPSPLHIRKKQQQRDDSQSNSANPDRWPGSSIRGSSSSQDGDLSSSSARYVPPSYSSSVVSRNSTNSTTTSGSNPNSNSTSTSTTIPTPIPITVIPMALYLPSEKNNFAGFCKGAWKLQLGLKKAFTTEFRPEGMYSTVPFWRCSKCYYEGPMMIASSSSSSSTNGGSSFGSRSKSKPKPTRTFDTRLRIHPPTGIRYRWSFLAKSHVATSRVLPGTDGSAGTFGCIFCCAERRTAAPMFGNLSSFMEHLAQEHRTMSVDVVEALRERIRCVVGREAGREEDFDVNFPPPPAAGGGG